MEDLLYYLLLAFGLVALGAGGGGLLRKKLLGRKEKDASAPVPRPIAGESIAPSKDEIEATNEEAKETDRKVEEVKEREKDIVDNPPSPVDPDDDVVDFLRRRSER